MNPLEQGVAQLGRWNGRIFALSMLLRPEDLPGDGWRILSEKGWRWGQLGPTFDRKRVSPDGFKSEETERAKLARGFCAWRLFETKDRRGFWTQIAPFASAEDADAMIPKMQSSGKRNPRFDGSITEEHSTGDCPITGVSKVLVHEQSVTTPRGHSTTTYIYGSVDNYVLALAFSRGNSDFSLRELIVVAERQAGKITAMRATRKTQFYSLKAPLKWGPGLTVLHLHTGGLKRVVSSWCRRADVHNPTRCDNRISKLQLHARRPISGGHTTARAMAFWLR